MKDTKAGRREFVVGMGRNPGEEKQVSHLYLFDGDDYYPMCGYAWNRSRGEAFSIFRGHVGAKGICKLCEKNKAKGLTGVPPWPHKTRWL